LGSSGEDAHIHDTKRAVSTGRTRELELRPHFAGRQLLTDSFRRHQADAAHGTLLA